MISSFIVRLALPFIISFAILLSPVAAIAETQAEYQVRIDAADRQIKQLAEAVESARQKRESLMVEVTSADTLIEGRDKRIKELRDDIKQYESKVTQLESSIIESEQALLTDKVKLASMMRRSMQVSANTGLQVMLQHTDPALASRLGVYYDYYFRASGIQIQAAALQLGTIRDAHHEALKSRNWLEHLKKKASGQRQTLEGDRTTVVKSIGQVDGELTSMQQSVENLRADQKRLGELLKELKKNTLGASGFFAASKGKYPWPVQGKLAAKFGDEKSVGKLTWTGLYIEADAGRNVRAIADGEVVYADWLQGFGMLVILDHGDGYMTLYGGNRELSVRTRAWVETGATIATVGDSRGHKRPGVYFEIRHNAKPVNPERWVNARNRFETADK